jgi:ABC-type histidine transport system ATPase subunit
MKDSAPVYWQMRNGELISVDDMDVNHLRNVLKMIIRNSKTTRKKDAFLQNFIEEEINEIERQQEEESDYPY